MTTASNAKARRFVNAVVASDACVMVKPSLSRVSAISSRKSGSSSTTSTVGSSSCVMSCCPVRSSRRAIRELRRFAD